MAPLYFLGATKVNKFLFQQKKSAFLFPFDAKKIKNLPLLVYRYTFLTFATS
jgi:hypothetical protein